MKKQKSKKQLNLIERSKRREDRSVVRPALDREKSPNLMMKRSTAGLKRIKSSTALHTMFKKGK